MRSNLVKVLSCDTPLLIIFYFGMIQNFQNLQIQFLGGGAILAKCSYVTSSVSLPAPFAKNTCNQCKNLPLTIPCTGAFTHFGDKTTSFTFEAKFTISFLFDASPDYMFSAIDSVDLPINPITCISKRIPLLPTPPCPVTAQCSPRSAIELAVQLFCIPVDGTKSAGSESKMREDRTVCRTCRQNRQPMTL